MDRRSFIGTVASLLGISVAAKEPVQEALPTTVKKVTGPYCVEVCSPDKHKETLLPLFDNLRQAQNFALARMNLLKNPINGGATHGKILITLPNGTVCEALSWGPTWTQTMAYVDFCDDDMNRSKYNV